MNSTLFVNNFSSGQVDDKFDGRFDVTGKYRSGSDIVSNMLVNHFGNAYKIPGTYHIGEACNNGKLSVLHSFIYSHDEALSLEFSEYKMRIIYNKELVESGGSPYEVTTPYAEADLRNIKLAQDKDIVYVVDGAHYPRKLIRTANDNWAMSLAPLTWGPRLPSNLDDTHTLACSVTAAAATGTLTSSTAFFDADHYDATEGGAIFSLGNGYVRLTGAPTDSTHAPIVVVEVLSSGAATNEWWEGAFSVYRGFPVAVAFHESRLFLGGTDYSKKRVWGSVTFSYEDFEETSDDNSALNYDIVTSKNNIIRWLDSGKTLGIGSSGSIRNLSTGSAATGITPDNFQFREETSIGANGVSPVSIDDAVYYISANGKTLREFVYNFQSDSLKSYNMNIISDDIVDSEIVQIAVQHYPYDVIWVVTSAGTLLSFTRNREQEIAAWCVHPFDGQVESVCVIPNGVEDQILLSVKRTINSSVVRHLEYVMPQVFGNSVEDAFYVRDGITYDGVATTTITELGHLEGETVSILKDGANHPSKVVSGGSITLDRVGNKVHVGKGYLGKVKTLNLEGGSMNGTSQGKMKRIRSAVVRLYKSVGFSIYTENNTNANTPSFRSGELSQGEPIPLFTGDKKVKLPDSIDRNASIVVESDAPLPLHILGIFPLMSTADV